MLALSISDVRNFMVKLLKEEVFDDFQARNTVINTFVRFEIHGSKDDGCVMWGVVRPYVFDIIKRGQQPKSIKIILGKEERGADSDNPISLFVNIHFEDGKISLTTGISKRGFSLDKSDDEKWDAQVIKFLNDNDITYINEMQR